MIDIGAEYCYIGTDYATLHVQFILLTAAAQALKTIQ